MLSRAGGCETGQAKLARDYCLARARQEIRAFLEKNAAPDQVTRVWLDQRFSAAHAKLLAAYAVRAPASAGHFFHSGCSAWTLLLA
ncbi:MAG: hypothetical protein DMD98_19960 [Candidatus Rokuibacteriota bacterium]|nr:MAG: hypothetical protein AUH99_12125 [Candidatus Rokubacteria bacterium 13_2_20CM_2_70_11]PYN29941.1 MAG: hypothetical protein DMD98_19960 [Candidatus Rokubacteria bacterium]